MDNSAPRAECGNCGAALTGPYCSACGQHAHDSARSVGALYHDAWHLLTHVDSRLWQSLYLLLLRPGRLTQEYFAERRVRYLPPVRLYLVLSVLFFAFVALAPNGDSPPSAAPVVDKTLPPTQIAQAKKRGGFTLTMSDCQNMRLSLKWLENPLRRACMRQVNTGGDAWTKALFASIPKMMFVFVPMIALVMLLLYRRPRHYYVEHLVFFLHNHAAVFLILLLESLLGWLAAFLGWRAFAQWVIFFTTLYSVWYVYRAMRVYYAQGRWLTFVKFLIVGIAYTAGLVATLAAAYVLSVLIV